MHRRYFLKGLAAASLAFFVPTKSFTADFSGEDIVLRCLGDQPGAQYLHGLPDTGTVNLVKTLKTATTWHVINRGRGTVSLRCSVNSDELYWLDGHTHDGTVGLAPTTARPYTGTRWQLVPLDAANPNIVALYCLGERAGAQYLDGRTHNGSVGLARNTLPPFTGTHWEISRAPSIFD